MRKTSRKLPLPPLSAVIAAVVCPVLVHAFSGLHIYAAAAFLLTWSLCTLSLGVSREEEESEDLILFPDSTWEKAFMGFFLGCYLAFMGYVCALIIFGIMQAFPTKEHAGIASVITGVGAYMANTWIAVRNRRPKAIQLH